MPLLFGIDCDNTLIPFHMHKLLQKLQPSYIKMMLNPESDAERIKIVEAFEQDYQQIKQGFDFEAAERVLNFIDWAVVKDSVMSERVSSLIKFGSSQQTVLSFKPLLEDRISIRDLIAAESQAFLAFFRTASTHGHQVAIVSNTLFPGILPAILRAKGLSMEEIADVACVGGQADYENGSEYPSLHLSETESEDLISQAGKLLHLLDAQRKLNKGDISRPANQYVLIDDDTNNLFVASSQGCRVIRLEATSNYALHVFQSSELLALASSTVDANAFERVEKSSPISIEGLKKLPPPTFHFGGTGFFLLPGAKRRPLAQQGLASASDLTMTQRVETDTPAIQGVSGFKKT